MLPIFRAEVQSSTRFDRELVVERLASEQAVALLVNQHFALGAGQVGVVDISHTLRVLNLLAHSAVLPVLL